MNATAKAWAMSFLKHVAVYGLLIALAMFGLLYINT